MALTQQEQELKSLFIKFFAEKKVKPPITRTKIEKAGYEVGSFIKELATNLKPYSEMPLIQDYLEACKRLI